MTEEDADRLRKLLAMLASPHDGEVLAAVSRLKATLERMGLRPEDLVQPPGMGARASPAPGRSTRPSPPPEAPRRPPEPSEDVEDRLGEEVPVEPAHAFAAVILSYRTRLPPAGVRFLNDLVMNRQRKVSVKQEAFLRSLASQTIRDVKRAGMGDARAHANKGMWS
jgi:hypothetical protein